jgi:RNA polymerase-binding transcription factor DksA
MSNVVMHQHKSLTKSQVKEIRAELERESRRLGPDDLRSHAFAAALHRLERGTYGYCATCGDRIPHERLFVMPETVYCVNCRRDRAA